MEPLLKKAGYKVRRGMDEITLYGKEGDEINLFYNTKEGEWQVGINIKKWIKGSDNIADIQKLLKKVGFK